jgi:hypothetical protein
VDLAAPFKPEVLRPFISVVVPGLIAVSPYVLLLGYYVTPVQTFWGAHSHAFAGLLAAAVLAVGFILSDFGELIEVHLWDRKLKTIDQKHEEKWERYLQLQLDDELIGQRFLRTKLTQYKFELAMVPALVWFWSGLLWLQIVQPIWSPSGFSLFSVALGLGTVYLLWESWNTAKSLANARTWILNAILSGPKGIARTKSGA